MWRWAPACPLSNSIAAENDSDAFWWSPDLLVGEAALEVVFGVGRIEADGVVEVGDRFLVVAEHHVGEAAVVVGGRVAVAGGDGVAIRPQRLLVVADLGIGKAFPRLARGSPATRWAADSKSEIAILSSPIKWKQMPRR